MATIMSAVGVECNRGILALDTIAFDTIAFVEVYLGWPATHADCMRAVGGCLDTSGHPG